MKKLTVIVLLLIGCVLGPVQLIYCLGFSGRTVTDFPVTYQQPHTVDLSPDMNPIRLTASVKYEGRFHDGRDYRSGFQLEISDKAGNQLDDVSFSVSEKRDVEIGDDRRGTGITIEIGERKTVSSIPFHVFDVTDGGSYAMTVTKSGRQEIQVQSMSMNVRRNVRVVNVPSLVVGFGLLVITVFGSVAWLMFRPQRFGNNPATHADA